jgi:unsaturated rhamnogalacturonyl hydrolase
MPTSEEIADALDRVALGMCRLKGIHDVGSKDGDVRIQFDEWDWEVGVGLYGLYRQAVQRKDQATFAALEAWYDWQIGRGLPPRQINSTAPMLPLVMLLGHVDRPDLYDLVCDWAQWLVTALPKTEDGGFQHVVKERLNEGELWDDTLFMACLFLARAGKIAGRQDWIDEAVYQFLLHARYLSNAATGLWYHGWTFLGRHNFACAFWARGNAWITVAIPELLDLVPEIASADRRFLVAVLTAQVATLKRLQRADGMWTTLLDDPASPIEASATAGFAYGILRGIDAGILPETDRQHADRALDAVLARIDPDGIVLDVSDGTPMGHDLDFYRRIGNVAAPYGQALAILLLAEVLRGAIPGPVSAVA